MPGAGNEDKCGRLMCSPDHGDELENEKNLEEHFLNCMEREEWHREYLVNQKDV